jgi:hypothetical protein
VAVTGTGGPGIREEHRRLGCQAQMQGTTGNLWAERKRTQRLLQGVRHVPDQAERSRQASQDANEKPVRTLKEQKVPDVNYIGGWAAPLVGWLAGN